MLNEYGKCLIYFGKMRHILSMVHLCENIRSPVLETLNRTPRTHWVTDYIRVYIYIRHLWIFSFLRPGESCFMTHILKIRILWKTFSKILHCVHAGCQKLRFCATHSEEHFEYLMCNSVLHQKIEMLQRNLLMKHFKCFIWKLITDN